MTAREKLDEAKFFLGKLRSVSIAEGEPQTTPDEFMYYASACAWA